MLHFFVGDYLFECKDFRQISCQKNRGLRAVCGLPLLGRDALAVSSCGSRRTSSATSSGAGQGWRGQDGELKLSGRSRARRVVILRRPLQGALLLADHEELQLAFVEKNKRAMGLRIRGAHRRSAAGDRLPSSSRARIWAMPRTSSINSRTSGAGAGSSMI
jgi:hypothetical protein